jgi:pimeloyl-ACP methyl ester carboxylesterase
VLLVTVVSRTSKQKEVQLQTAAKAEPLASVKSTEGEVPGAITLGEDKGVPYYHCSGAGSGDEVTLILLHGMAFTKEDWKKPSGILKDLCTRETQRKLSVFAVDLPVTADFKDLTMFLDSLSGQGKVTKPVSLVTPSASGKTMATWAGSAAVEHTLPQYISRWIPVAPVAFSSVPEHDIRNMINLPTLAIYGSKDTRGKDVSNRLKEFANARVLELHGGHPCYLDSPKEFVDEVVAFLDQP